MSDSKSQSQIEEGTDLELHFEKRGGILPVAVQETSTGRILMIASVNREAFEHTLKKRRATFWSTSRNELWEKGLTSGNKLLLDEVLVDCDQDSMIYKVTLEGDGVCHTRGENGKHRKACFYRKLDLESKTLEFTDE